MATDSTSPQQGNETETARITPKADKELQRYREQVTARLAGSIVGLFAVSVVAAFIFVREPAFAQVKEIVSVLTPIVGVVLGFYFNKASTEKRAENAEQTAEAASKVAQQAVAERHEAQTEASVATESLDEVTTAAQELIAAGETGQEAPGDAAADTRDPHSRGVARGARHSESAAVIRLQHAIDRSRARSRRR